MNNIEIIREELKTIKLYYSSKAQLDIAFKYIQSKATERILSTYTEMISNAPLDLYMLYYELYVNGNTQEDAAEELGYSVEYLRQKKVLLLQYFQEKLEVAND